MNGHWEVKDGLHPARFRADISRVTLMSVGPALHCERCSGDTQQTEVFHREDRRLLRDAVGSTHHRYFQALVQGTLLVLLEVFCVSFHAVPTGADHHRVPFVTPARLNSCRG